MSPETEAVSFPTWKSALANTGWPEAQQTEYRREILAFLHLCKVRRAPATVMLVKEYLAERARQGPNAARVPLLWFFQEAKRVAKGEVAGVKPAPQAAVGHPPVRAVARGSGPPRAAEDQGGADWERDLIKAARSKGLLWRSEETYRGWAARFARFLAPRSPYAAEAGDVAL